MQPQRVRHRKSGHPGRGSSFNSELQSHRPAEGGPGCHESEYGLSTTAYLSLGSNLGDRAANLRTAIERLNGVAMVLRVSSFYETEPMEFRDQPWFLNCAVEVQTGKTALEFLADTQVIEHDLGRNRALHKGPRTLDIDLLLFGDEVIDQAGLTVPHPRMHLRRFVLAPLAELSSALPHPVLGKTVRDLLSDLGTAGGEVRRIE